MRVASSTLGARARGILAALVILAALAGCGRFAHAVGPDDGRFVASRTGKVYHRPDCGMAKRISREHLLYYRSGDDAYKDRFTPCHACHPERDHESDPGPAAKP